MKRRSLTWLFALFLTLNCGRNTDFLSHSTNPPTRPHSMVHPLKELKKKSGADILWVIANNAGMEYHQGSVERGTSSFITEIVKRTGWDWKMGIISMDPNDAPFVGFPGQTPLDYKTPKGADVFKKSLKLLGTSGDKKERAFEAIQTQLNARPDFLRDDVALVVIFVSDGPERSKIDAAEMLKFLLKKKNHLDNIIVYGAFASNFEWGCKDSNEPWKFSTSPYQDLIKTTKGQSYHLCYDFGVSLGTLGNDIITRVMRRYVPLKERPIAGSIRVLYKGKDVMGGVSESGGYWSYDFELNRVVIHDFSFAPGDNEEVTISYESA